MPGDNAGGDSEDLTSPGTGPADARVSGLVSNEEDSGEGFRERKEDRDSAAMWPFTDEGDSVKDDSPKPGKHIRAAPQSPKKKHRQQRSSDDDDADDDNQDNEAVPSSPKKKHKQQRSSDDDDADDDNQDNEMEHDAPHKHKSSDDDDNNHGSKMEHGSKVKKHDSKEKHDAEAKMEDRIAKKVEARLMHKMTKVFEPVMQKLMPMFMGLMFAPPGGDAKSKS
jgi:hypothetical protein